MARLAWPGGFALAAFAILVGLGTWQMQRLRWKEDILARIDQRIHADPVDLPSPAQWSALAASDYEYMRVRVSGVYDHTREALIFRPAGGAAKQPGYHVMTPLVVAEGAGVVLVNRGFVPESRKSAAARPGGQTSGVVTITGLLRAPEARSMFTPADQPAQNLWFTRDPVALARHLRLAGAAPFSIDAEVTPNAEDGPQGGATVVSIRNDHLAYALTWYGLALTLLGVFAAFAWRRLKAD